MKDIFNISKINFTKTINTKKIKKIAPLNSFLKNKEFIMQLKIISLITLGLVCAKIMIVNHISFLVGLLPILAVWVAIMHILRTYDDEVTTDEDNGLQPRPGPFFLRQHS